jgi:2-oxoglutarate dehydrogenase E2 component (dihydrolipoamide succinyltransferase)
MNKVLVDVPMPQMGSSVAEGTVIEWTKSVGEEVRAEETLCEISSDKVDTEVPAPVDGVLAEILVDVEQTVAVGTLLARIAVSSEQAQVEAPAETPAAPAADGAARRGGYSPVVKRVAEAHGVDLSEVEGTGRGGRVGKRDVLAYIEQSGAAAEPPAALAPESAPLSRMRRTIAEHMSRSVATAAHCHTWIEVDMSAVEAERRALGLTALPLVASATVAALAAHPSVNAWLEGDTRTLHRDVNLGIAVSLGEDGLIVPVVRRAQTLSLEELAARIQELAERARSGDLTPDEVQDGTFTITNPGRFGSLMAAPIINQPQVAILDLETIAKRPVVVQDARGDDALAIRATCILGLAWDHRALDGALAAQFLATVKANLEGFGAERS